MTDTEEGHDDIYSIWSQFNSAVQDRMTEAVEAGNDGYRQLHESWSDLAKGMTDFATMLDPSVPETMEVYNVWRNYSLRMARRMDTVMSERQQRYDRLLGTWGEWTSGIGAMAVEAGDADAAAAFERTYIDWLMFSGRFLAEIARGRDGTGASAAELTRTWTAFSRTMTAALDRLVKNGGERYRGVSKAWLDFIGTVGENLEHFTTGTENDFNELYEMWVRESQELARKMVRAAPSGAHEHGKRASGELAEAANGGGVSK